MFASSNSQAHLGGGLELTTADWARIARLYIDRGRVGGTQVVSEAWIDASLTDHVQIDDKTNYGYLWWRPAYEVDGNYFKANMMSGSGGNRVYVLPEFGIVVVLTKNDFGDREAHPKSDRFFVDEIIKRLDSNWHLPSTINKRPCGDVRPSRLRASYSGASGVYPY